MFFRLGDNLFLPLEGMPLIRKALTWLIPWTSRDFPGFQRGALSALPRDYGWTTVEHWEKNRHPMPATVATHLANTIESRIRDGAIIVGLLRDYSARVNSQPPRARGFCVVDPTTGRSRRGRNPRVRLPPT